MKRFIVVLVLLAIPQASTARLMKAWSYQQMFDTADLVVIATPSLSADTEETASLPGYNEPVDVAHVNTELIPRLVLKGVRPRKLVLHHFRFATAMQAECRIRRNSSTSITSCVGTS